MEMVHSNPTSCLALGQLWRVISVPAAPYRVSWGIAVQHTPRPSPTYHICYRYYFREHSLTNLPGDLWVSGLFPGEPGVKQASVMCSVLQILQCKREGLWPQIIWNFGGEVEASKGNTEAWKTVKPVKHINRRGRKEEKRKKKTSEYAV